MTTKTTPIERQLNTLRRAVDYGFEIDQNAAFAAIINAAEDYLWEERDYDRIEIADYVSETFDCVMWNDGDGVDIIVNGELINAGADRNKNEYYVKSSDGTWKEVSIARCKTGDTIYVRVYNCIDSEGQCVALVTKYIV